MHEQYTEEIREELDYVAMWLPSTVVHPGDVCDVKDDKIRVVSHLSEFGIEFEVVDMAVETGFDYSSKGEVSVQFKVKGDAAPPGSELAVDEAGVSMSFGRTNAVVLQLANCTGQRLKSLHKVGQQVLDLHRDDAWPEGYVVVNETVTAGASTIVISNAKEASMDLVAKGAVGSGPLQLASLDAGLETKRASSIGIQIVAKPGLTPLAQFAGVQRRFLRPDRFKAGQTPDEFTFDSLDYVDLPR